jgi:hypothetical protein
MMAIASGSRSNSEAISRRRNVALIAAILTLDDVSDDGKDLVVLPTRLHA